MAGSSISVTIVAGVRSNTIGKLIDRLGQNMHAIVDQAATDIQARASQTAPVDTGALRNSIYVNNGTDSDYNERVSVASSLNPEMIALEEIDPEFVIAVATSPGDAAYVSVVGVAADYGLFQELGTRHMRAQPFMLPSALGVQGDFETAMTHVAD